MYMTPMRGLAMPERYTLRRIQDLSEFRARLLEQRALQVSSDTAGGYLVTGGFMNLLLSQEQSVSAMRIISRVLEPLGEGLDEIGVPSEEACMADAEWVTELTVGTEDTTQSFGKRVLHPHPISKRIRVGNKLLRSQENAESWITAALATAIATPQEVAFINGSGAGEPLGLLNTEDLPVYETAGSGTLTGDDIRGWLFSLPASFQRSARILTSVDFLRHVLKMKDGAGNYVFPDYRGQLLDKPVTLTDGMPAIVDASDALVAGEYAAVVGDFRFYWIVDSEGVVIQLLNELYAETHEVGFQAWQETDGMCVLPAAFYGLQIKA